MYVTIENFLLDTSVPDVLKHFLNCTVCFALNKLVRQTVLNVTNIPIMRRFIATISGPMLKFFFQFMNFCNKLVFVPGKVSQPRLMLVRRLEPTQVEHLLKMLSYRVGSWPYPQTLDQAGKVYGECTTSRRTSCPKRFHEKIFYLSCIFL